MFRTKKKIPLSLVSKQAGISLDLIAKRYGVLPSNLLKLSVDDYTFNTIVAKIAIDKEVADMKKQQRKAKK